MRLPVDADALVLQGRAVTGHETVFLTAAPAGSVAASDAKMLVRVDEVVFTARTDLGEVFSSVPVRLAALVEADPLPRTGEGWPDQAADLGAVASPLPEDRPDLGVGPVQAVNPSDHPSLLCRPSPSPPSSVHRSSPCCF